MPRKTKPRRGWYPPGLSVLSDHEKSGLYDLAVEIEPASPDALSQKLIEVAITYHLRRQHDIPEAPRSSEKRAALKDLCAALNRAHQCLLTLDSQSFDVLDLAYRSAEFDGSHPKRPRYPMSSAGNLEDDSLALERLDDRATVAFHHLSPKAGGAPSLDTLRWAVGELASIFGPSFSVGGERADIDMLNKPAHWVSRVIQVIDPNVTDANLRTAFRQDFSGLQKPPA